MNYHQTILSFSMLFRVTVEEPPAKYSGLAAVRVTISYVSQILTVAIVSPIEDVFGGELVVVVVLIAQGMHCSGKCGTHDCRPKVHAVLTRGIMEELEYGATMEARCVWCNLFVFNYIFE
ncbi:hypothetical protein DEO72_LG8g1469 [Vigna unguiculata]|uniref:Uncharacterized protein n=1 Tax=Vigna unguiculata TaxID=3917 RepID=A0A4D6MU65_VIGUN|nr:hypothetical protein DEO72_LG8g1469 [Vigna unguiculata]